MKKYFLITLIFFLLHLLAYQTKISKAVEENPNCITEEKRILDPSYNVFSHSLNNVSANTFNTNKPLDENRPNLCGLTGACPTITSAYTFTPKPGESTQGWGATQAVGIQTTGGQTIYVPPSGRTLGSGMQVLVSNLNAQAGTISLQFTLDANFSNANGEAVNRYDLHLSGLNINPEIVSAFNSRANDSSNSLPALPAGFKLGQARSGEVVVSMADTGAFMNLLELNDFWKGDISVNQNDNWLYLKYLACLQQPTPIQNTCDTPLTGADDYSCPGECLGASFTLGANTALALNLIKNIPIFGDAVASLLYAQVYKIPISLDDGTFKAQIPKFSNSHTLYDTKNTTPAALVAGRLDLLDTEIKPELNNIYYNPNGDTFGENPPTANSSIQNLLTPDDKIKPEKIPSEIKKAEKQASEVKFIIENTGSDVGGGSPPGEYWAEGDLKKLGISIDRDVSCNTGGCWVPRVKVCKPNESGCGGGGVAVYVTYDAKGPANPTATINRGDKVENLEKKPNEPDQAHVWGFESVTLGGATVHLADHAYLLEDGTIQHKGHAPTAIFFEWCQSGSVETCYTDFEKISKTNIVSSEEGGGPIITAQEGMYATRQIQCAYTQSFFAPPGVIYCEGTIPGIALEERYSKNVLALRQEYRQLVKNNELALNLSEDEKIERTINLVKQNHASLLSRLNNKYNNTKDTSTVTLNNNVDILNKLEEKKDKIVETQNNNTTKTEQIAFFTPQTSCPNRTNSQEEKVCDNNSAPKPDTVIYMPPNIVNVECPGGNCAEVPAPGEAVNTHRVLVKTAFSSGENVSVGDFSNSIMGSEVIEKTNYYNNNIASLKKGSLAATGYRMPFNNSTAAKVSMDIGSVQTSQINLAMLTNTPDKTRTHNESRSGEREFGLTANPNFLGQTFTKFEVSNSKWQEYLEGSTVCQRYYRSFNLSPEDKDGQQLLKQNITGCYEETITPENRESVANTILELNAGNYYNWTGDYDAKSPLPITGKAMYYAKSWGDNMERIFENRGYEGNLKDVCPDCDGAGAMLRAGDKERVVCVKVDDTTSKAYGQTFKVYVVDVAGRGDINNLLNRNWAIDLDYSLGQKMGMVGVGPKMVSITECK